MTERERSGDKERESEKFRDYMKAVTERLKQHPEEARQSLVDSGLYNMDGTRTDPYK